MKRRKATPLFMVLAIGAGLFSANGAHAALTSVLGGQAVYDSDINVTWVADASLSASNHFGLSSWQPGGGVTMTWDGANSWIGAMNAANYLGFNDWRLPTTLQPDASCSVQYSIPGYTYSSGYGCTGSEMGHLFYNELGGVAGSPVSGSGDPDLALFKNLNSYPSNYFYYWSGTKAEVIPDEYAWIFGMRDGYQLYALKEQYRLAWAVRTGGNPVGAVPEPETYAMLLAGLGLMGAVARRHGLA